MEKVDEKLNTSNVEQDEIITDIEKEMDVEAIEEKVRSQVKKELEQENALSIEAERVAYLKTLDLNSVEDETTRKIIEEVISSKLKREDKVESVKKLFAQSAILSCLKKAEHMDADKLNSYAIATLKSLKKYDKNLNEKQIIQAESAIATLEVDFKSIGKENLSRGLSIQVDIEKLTPVERLKYTMSKYQKEELEKRANFVK